MKLVKSVNAKSEQIVLSLLNEKSSFAGATVFSCNSCCLLEFCSIR